MIKIYGVPMSRALRCLWMAEELELEFENVPVHHQGEAQEPGFVELNPNGRIPVLDDGGLVLFESMAINLHLAARYGKPPLWPSSREDRARSLQWTFWSVTEAELPSIALMQHRALRPEAERDPRAAAEAEAQLQRPLAVLEDALEGRDYLLGSAFSVADLNAACIFAFPAAYKVMDLAPWAKVRRWCRACTDRPALARALGRA